MSELFKIDSPKNNEVVVVKEVHPKKKVLEEDEYIDRMATIIRRDFFSDSDPYETPRTNDYSEKYGQTPSETPMSSTSSVASRRQSCSLSLNDYLAKYTSEDNDYFEKLQDKDLKRHKMKYPWLYANKGDHNHRVNEQLKLPTMQEQASIGSDENPTRMIDWPHNPKNTLFYAPPVKDKPIKTTINYNSNKYIKDSNFKEPFLPRQQTKPQTLNRISDKIGIDGRLIDGSRTPSINGYSYIPEPSISSPALTQTPKPKFESNKFYIPSDSPRDDLAHRLYQEKVARHIRTPKREPSQTPSTHIKTPSTRGRSYSEFAFSPERITKRNK